jgi:hypothetical protein
MGSGRLMKDSEHEEKEGGEETKKNGNGNGNGSNGNGGEVSEGWSVKYKKSIDCKNPKGFSQRAHCQGRKVNEAKEKDHEVSMAKTQVKKSIDNLQKVARVLAKKTDADNLPAWLQSKLTDTEHNTDAAASYMTGKEDLDEGKRDGKSAKDKDYSLRDWFAGGGWVQAGGKYDGKPCAKQPGQKTKPFCRDPDDRAAMSKDEREKRAKKKREKDPKPNRSGKAKIVRQESYSNWREDLQEKIGIPTGPGTPYKNPEDALEKMVYPEKVRRLAPLKQASIGDQFRKTSVNDGMRWKGLPSRIPEKELQQHYKGADRFKPPILQQAHYEPEGKLIDEEGKKDACYKKVKSRYKIWPSAYASGALSKCRKVGAANWGNSTKKEGYEFSNWRDDFQPIEIETVDLITADPIQVLPSNLQKIEEKCWVGYTQKGMKKKGGKMVPNCVKEGQSNWRKELSENGSELIEDWQKENRKDNTDGMSPEAVKAYRRENPESKLQTAVTEKNPKGKRKKRRKSFCDRSDGQRKMHNIDCSKTPEKKICKARKRWRC